ncbi:putative 2-aminoethylphosphonate ABC transporter substrate-binding protein, partial [Vibrio sp. YT-19(2023)]|nr:putative 2-aminoethylphosphonate ABC transporter substrate-binding protein [Vibrio sp. YT-19(2023)]
EMYPVVGHKEVKATVSNFPNVQENMAKMDFPQMGSKRAEILATWSEKFDAKSEPKS